MKTKTLAMLVLLLSFSAMTFAQNDDSDDDNSNSPCENAWGPDSTETVTNLSMFNQFFQEKKYAESFEYWLYLFENAPCIKKRITYNGPYIIKKALSTGNYKERQAGLIDTIFLCHQMRIKFYGNEGYVKGKWAEDIARLTPNNIDKALDMYFEAVKISGNATDDGVPADFMITAVKMYKKDMLSIDSLFMIFDDMNSIVEYNIGLNGPKNDDWLKARENITKIISPYLDCDKIKELKEPLFAEQKNNVDYLKFTLKLLDKGGCDGSAFYLQLSEQLYSIEPSGTAALSLAKAFLKSGDASKALKYYGEAESGFTGEELYDIYIKEAQLNLQAGKLSPTRDFARKALEIKPNSGEAYLLIGDAYASTRGCTGSCEELGGREVYWAAVDKYAKARSVDPSVEEKANQKIAKFSAYFPDKEKAFFCSLIDGQSYTVGCWIGETTTVRTISSN